jgi:hypothetical protein
MSIKIGTSDVTDIKIGTTNVNTVYIGSTVIWQRGSVYTYTLSLGLTYSTGTYILASGERTATLTVTRKTYINSVYQSDLDTLVDADSIVFTYEPSGCDFSATRTSLGTYTISAASRGTVPSAETDATIRVNYTPPSSSQIYETTTVKQEANAVIDTGYDTVIEISISSNYDSAETPADAGGASWSVTASGREVNYEREQYTSLSWTSWVAVTDSPITASAITLSASGAGFSGSGNGGGTTVTWASRGTVTGIVREGVITPTYNGETYATKYVYQEANALEYTDNRVITSVLLDGVNNNITIPYTSDSITVSGSGTCTEHYTSGSSASGTFTIGASGFSVSGTGFSYSNYVVSVTENSGSERQGTVTASYSGATSVQRTITQQHVVYVPGVELGSPNIGSTSIQLVAAITDDGDGTISDCGFNFGEESGNLMTYDADEVVQSGNFTRTMTDLDPKTTYYLEAWATNEAGTTTTSEDSVSTLGIVSGSITAAQFQFGYTKADVTLVIDNDTTGQVNLGVISCTIKDGSTTVGSSSFNLGNNVVINAGATFNGSVSVTTSGANQSHTHIAYTSSIPQGVGVLQRTVTPPDI